MCDLFGCGGIQGTRDWFQTAHAMRLGTTLHSGPELGVGQAARLHVAAAHPDLRHAIDGHYHHYVDDVLVGGQAALRGRRDARAGGAGAGRGAGRGAPGAVGLHAGAPAGVGGVLGGDEAGAGHRAACCRRAWRTAGRRSAAVACVLVGAGGGGRGRGSREPGSSGSGEMDVGTRRRFRAGRGAGAGGVWGAGGAGGGCAGPRRGGRRAARRRPAEQGPVTVRYAQGWSTLYRDRLDKIVADFTARHPTIKAEHVLHAEQLQAAGGPATALAAGTPPDVTHAVAGGHARPGAKRGHPALDAYVKRDSFDPAIYYENEYSPPNSGQDVGAAGGGQRGLVPAVLQPRPLPRRRAGREQAPGDVGRGLALRRRAQPAGGRRQDRAPGLRAGPASDAGSSTPPSPPGRPPTGASSPRRTASACSSTPPGATAALEWMQRLVQADRRAARPSTSYFDRAKGAHNSFPIGQRAMYLTNHSFPARLKQVAPDLRYGIGTLPRGSAGGAAGHRPRGLVERHPGRRAGRPRGVAADRSTSRPPGKGAGGSCRSRCAPRRSRR